MDKEEASTTNPNSSRRVPRVANRLRTRLGMARRNVGERKAEALALGMSFAAFATLVVEKKNAADENTDVADLALIYASAVKESLANVYGTRIGSFGEISFNSTLRILKVTNDSVEKSKLEMGVSEAALRTERLDADDQTYETELEAEMSTVIMNWLVSSVINALAWMLYVSRAFTRTCMKENMLMCRQPFWLQIYFAILVILVVTYLIIHRSPGTKHSTRAPYSLLLLGGIFYGLLDMYLGDALDSIGKLWLFLWATVCLLRYVADTITLAMFGLVYGPRYVTQETKTRTMVPYWERASSLLVAILLFIPLINGFLPFATVGELGDQFGEWWTSHFSILASAVNL
ncbi:hypothetical protein IGI04_027550 [Brassica rapa subsp. trilocularis]|uniref:DUF4220 domain-containing protein n=1 Tax=Brassica rapa subsp. trilocularis TaxID=1813537 RepID=A0ABQ7L317_BRACM|nr:hypothetical protein IGI04_027550 [Brassica rapa subsp. trilocularis]